MPTINSKTSDNGEKKNLASYRDSKNKEVLSKSTTSTKPRYGIKVVGKNKVVLTPLSEIEAIVIEPPQISHPIKISPKMRRIAKILMKMPIAEVRRIGYDILDE